MRSSSQAVLGLLALICLLGRSAAADFLSYRNANPVGWMHLLPVGETPGWGSRAWIDIEVQQANVWNMEFSMTDRRNGDVYTYKADFEQTSAIANIGFQLFPTLAFSVEVPYADRNGGFLDDFIDQFHQVIGSDRFLRNFGPKYGNAFVVQTNGEDRLPSTHGDGLGGFKLKLKWWFLQWHSPTPGACDCGLALSAQVKFPNGSKAHDLTSGSNDYSGLVHFGFPINSGSAFWATAGVTKMGRNDIFAGWPTRSWQQMYESVLDIGFTKVFGLILQARAESPLFDAAYLDFNYTTDDEDGRIEERMASGFNSLVRWRGSEAGGFRWRWGKGSQINLLIIEDWGLGTWDERSDKLYVNNAPDVAFITQWHFLF
jgi:hypothetical protein